MTNSDKIRLKALDEKSDYALWRLRVEATCTAKGFTAALNTEEVPPGVDRGKFIGKHLQASRIIMRSLGDHALRVVRSVIGEATGVMEKLDARYD